MASENKKVELKKLVASLRETVGVLGGYIDALERLAPGFASVSAEYFRLIKKGRSSSQITKIVRFLFRSFLGFRDECMVLLTGELIRSYHQNVHKNYIHPRETENYYYKSNKYKLSSCSADGVDYEYRKLQDQKLPVSATINFYEATQQHVNAILNTFVAFCRRDYGRYRR
jgi:hypothetical protein